MSRETEFVWSDAHLLGYEPMDDTHHEFVDVVAALQTASDDAVPTALERVVEHLERHFAEEARWMAGNGFPARDCHIEEHDKVLASVPEVRAFVAAGRVDVARQFAQALEEWFPGHAAYMDSALALWMVKQSTGGAPVVIRRKSKTEEPVGN